MDKPISDAAHNNSSISHLAVFVNRVAPSRYCSKNYPELWLPVPLVICMKTYLKTNCVMKKIKNERRILTLTATVLALLVAASPAQGSGRNPNLGIIPPGSTYRGLSYGEWGAQWWKTIFSIPVVNGYHPLISGGAFEGEKGVVFLAAAAGGVTIDVTIRPGASLFVPVLNSECSVSSRTRSTGMTKPKCEPVRMVTSITRQG